MKKLILLLCISVFISKVNGQELEFGLKAGVNTGKGSISELNTMSADVKSINSFNGGIYGRLKIMVIGLYIQPELIYSSRGGIYDFNDNGKTFQVTNKANYIDVPVLIGMKFVKIFRIYAGPNFQFLINQNMDFPQQYATTIKTHDLNKKNIGAQFGVGLDLARVRLDLKYDVNPGSLGTFMDYANSSSVTTSPIVKNSMIVIQLGFKLWGIL